MPLVRNLHLLFENLYLLSEFKKIIPEKGVVINEKKSGDGLELVKTSEDDERIVKALNGARNLYVTFQNQS